MKKRFLVAAAVLTASASFAQQEKQLPPPPPPPPPVMDVRAAPAPPAAPGKQGLPKDYQAFLRRNPSVKNLAWSQNKVHVYLRSGKKEVYNLNNAEQMQSLEDKYGKLPMAPPPPPPPPKAP